MVRYYDSSDNCFAPVSAEGGMNHLASVADFKPEDQRSNVVKKYSFLTEDATKIIRGNPRQGASAAITVDRPNLNGKQLLARAHSNRYQWQMGTMRPGYTFRFKEQMLRGISCAKF